MRGDLDARMPDPDRWVMPIIDRVKDCRLGYRSGIAGIG